MMPTSVLGTTVLLLLRAIVFVMLLSPLAATAPRTGVQRRLAMVANACREYEPKSTCGAGRLPRITSRDWTEVEIRQFRARAAEGTVVVALLPESGRVRLLPDCGLPGKYAELKTRGGHGRLWVTDRALMIVDEVTSTACVEATHQVVAFAVGGMKASAAGPGTTATSPAASASSFSALLVPVPCPSVRDTHAARGCIAPGLTGAERRAKARNLINTLGTDDMSKVDPADALAVYAIAPDDYRARNYVARAQTECSMSAHVNWVLSQYRMGTEETGETVVRVLPPTDPHRNEDPLDFSVEGSPASCRYQPPFRKCFPDIAPASAGWTGCWDFADGPTPPRGDESPAPNTNPAPAVAPAAGCAPAPSPTIPKKALAP